ncbi:ArsC/Spx/MgsR family protein [Crocosphaera chwakensis]|uniref:Nitrogenase-associated protein n=1 Tax=Crocosphaera chwakensis CCY0110 TaxID=391612 RepID=A3IL14_9CHRO|nr:ArsC/Spx/MgsR family protein [Crocosphaera chwakensis]EAZ92883.1 Nitrogenase-associated protein [Crocosphaera chwakensis CCY0110]
MANVTFYEKPGCKNNTKQKNLLIAAGHTLEAKSLLTESWTAEKLRPFFGDLSVSLWFNKSAPRIKSGEVLPDNLSEEKALELMIADPLLIRRPLIQVEAVYRVGFDPEIIDAWIGLNPENPVTEDLETCPRSHEQKPCATVQ